MTSIDQLVASVTERYRSVPTALRELCLETGKPLNATDEKCTTVRQTSWYAEMRETENSKLDAIRSSDEADSVRELAKGMYPNGVKASDATSAFVAIASMLPGQLPEKQISKLAQNERHDLSAAELGEAYIAGPLITAKFPKRWWVNAAPRNDSGLNLLRVGLRADPPTLCLEYEQRCADAVPAIVTRRRSIHLEAEVTPNGSVEKVAQKLHRSLHGLLSLERVRHYLMWLQRVMRGVGDPSSTIPAAAQHSAPAAAVDNTAASESADATGVDVGLLYRDPEAALKDVDLQAANDMEVKLYKEKMDEKFNANRIGKDDPRYVYDKRVEVKPTMKSEWDSD